MRIFIVTITYCKYVSLDVRCGRFIWAKHDIAPMHRTQRQTYIVLSRARASDTFADYTLLKHMILHLEKLCELVANLNRIEDASDYASASFDSVRARRAKEHFN